MTQDKYDVYSKFDLEKHKQRFENYFEVIIEEDGMIHYAVPSHQEFLINYICNKGLITRDQLNRICPKRYYMDFMRWLCMVSGCIAVYDSLYLAGDKLTYEQRLTLKILQESGVYKGSYE